VGSAAYVINVPAVGTPTFSPAAGTYSSAQNVTISTTTTGATIYYTTDGTDPTTSSSVYSSAINVASSETVKALAVKSGMTDSSVASAAYTIYAISAWYDTGYQYRKLITIDHTKVPNTDQTNFPILVSLTDNDLRTVANGGHVTSANGYDIIFTDSNGNLLSHEIESYDASSGTVKMWVKVPTLYHTTDTVIDMYYGNSSITASQENKAGVWGNGYAGVWHMDETGTNPTVNDSTSNANNSSTQTWTPDTGKLGGGGTFNGTNQYISFGNKSSLKPTSAITISYWVKTNSSASGNNGYSVLSTYNGYGSTRYGYNVGPNPSNAEFAMYKNNWNNYLYQIGNTTINNNSWHYVTTTYGGSLASTKVYVDGNLETMTGSTYGTPDAIAYDATPVTMGTYTSNSALSGVYFTGSLDEMHVSNVARSADWIATEYNNENNPATFMGAGSEEANMTAVSTPTFSPVAGTYSSAQNVTISTTTNGATIYYTTDGSTPTTSSSVYSSAINVASTETLKAIAVKSGYTNSDVASALYTINIPVVSTPTFSPVAGTYSSAQNVEISTTTTGATIYYTTNGDTPTTSSSVYSSAINVSSSETIKAIAVKSGYTNSDVASALYTINIPVVSTPTFSVAAGTYNGTQSLTITTSTNGASIYYTTNGNTPDINSTLYLGALNVSSSETVKAIAIKSGMTDSSVASAAYTINPWYDANYGYRKPITIDHTKVSNTDQSNFPILVSLTDNSLKTVASGGKVQNSNGYDIIFTTNDDATKLSHEIESYDGTNGTIRMWVKVPSLSHTTDTTIHMYYGNSSITTSQEDKTNVWDSNFQAVWHLGETGSGSISDYKDSTSNANNGGDTTYEPTVNTSSKIGNGQTFNGTNSRIAIPNSSSMSQSGSFTLEGWIKTATTGKSFFEKIGSHYNYQLQVQNNYARFKTYDGTNYPYAANTTSVVDNNWHHIVAVRDNSAHTLTIYVDGTLGQQVTDTATGSFTNTTAAYLGARGDLNSSYFFNGSLDEFRVSSSTRSADWIATEYSNENNPGSFMSEGSETSRN
jgi:hypothetical protein